MSKKKNTFRKRKEKMGDFLIDLCKYVVTVVLFTKLFKDASEWGTLENSLTILVVAAFFMVAIILQEDEPINNLKKK